MKVTLITPTGAALATLLTPDGTVPVVRDASVGHVLNDILLELKKLNQKGA